MKWQKHLKRTFFIVAAMYCVAGFLLYYFQNKLIFHPVQLNAAHAFNFSWPHNEVMIKADDHSSYNIVQFSADKLSVHKGLVLYFHGNMENISYYASNALHFTKHGYDVWMPDYPGFGKSTGKLTEQAMYDEAKQVYKLARAKGFNPDDIIIYGRSLGTGVAAYLADIRDCKRLILETPYYSLNSVAQHYCWMYPASMFLNYRLPTYTYLQKVTAPVTIFHGTDDNTIPYDNSIKLKPYLKLHDEFIAIPGGGHNNLCDFDVMKRKLDSLLSL